jgi:phospholipase/lecithinase/hemolysin
MKGSSGRRALLCLAIALGLVNMETSFAQVPGFGVLGDSNSDEYRANDNRGGGYSDVTFNWVEVLSTVRDLDFGTWGTRGEPRRTGYAYNWARSGARAEELVDQQSGLAQQVASGQVDFVFLHIGSNDFHPRPGGDYGRIYDGSISNNQLQQKINGVISDILDAVGEVEAAGAKVVVTGVPDAGLVARYHSDYPSATGRQRVTDAIDEINDAIEAEANGNSNVAFADISAFYAQLVTRIDSQGYLVVGGERINMAVTGNEPHFLQLDDSSAHLGTVGSGLMANGLFLEPLNAAFQTDIELLSDQDILCIAGINTGSNCLPEDPVKPNPPILSIDD